MNLQYFSYTHSIAHDDSRRSNSASSPFHIFLSLATDLFNNFHIFDSFFAASKVYMYLHRHLVQILDFYAIFSYLASNVHF